jgi:hypothetical protein
MDARMPTVRHLGSLKRPRQACFHGKRCRGHAARSSSTAAVLEPGTLGGCRPDSHQVPPLVFPADTAPYYLELGRG